VRLALPRLERPILAERNRYIELGARDEEDARQMAVSARELDVKRTSVSEIRGRLRRWRLRQRLAGNYAPRADGGFTFFHGNVGGRGGDGGGGG